MLDETEPMYFLALATLSFPLPLRWSEKTEEGFFAQKLRMTCGLRHAVSGNPDRVGKEKSLRFRRLYAVLEAPV